MSQNYGPSYDDTNFGEIGNRPEFQYWNDLVNVFSNVATQQSMHLVGLWQRWALGGYDPGQGVGSLPYFFRQSIESMLTLSSFPFAWWMRRSASVPSIVFIADHEAEVAGPQTAPSPIAAEGLTPDATDLVHVNGKLALLKSHVQVQLVDRGNRVEVTLVNLGQPIVDPTVPPVNILEPGVYMGLAYAWDGPGMRRPLAVIYLFVPPLVAVPPPISTTPGASL
jgi:hypothetical protein